MALEVYINDNLIELENPNNIGLTFQVFSIFNVEGRSGFLSSPIKAPKTKANNEIFENLSNINSNSNLPYQRNTAKIIQDGLEIVPNGFALIKDTTDSYNFNVFSGNSSFFDLIKGLNINRLDWTDSNHTYDETTIKASWNDTENFIYPIIEWGNGIALLSNVLSLDYRALIPVAYVRDVLIKSSNEIGYQIKGDFINGSEISRMLLTPNNFGLTQAAIDEINGYSNNSNDIANYVETITTGMGVQTETLTLNLNFFSNPTFSASGYTPANDVLAELKGMNWYNITTPNGTVKTFLPKFKIFEDGIEMTTTNLINSNQSYTTQSYVIDEVSTGFVILKSTSVYTFTTEIELERLGVDYDVTFDFIGCNFSVEVKGAINFNDDIVFSTLFNYDTTLIWKDVMNVYNLLVQTNEIKKEIYLNKLNEISDNLGSSIDWSNKLVKGSIKVAHAPNNYAINNVFSYTNDEVVNKLTGRGVLEVSNLNLEHQKEFVKINAAAAAATVRLNGFQVPSIPFRDNITGQFVDKNIRYLMLDNDTTAVVLNGNENIPKLPLCYFSKAGKNDSLDFENLLSTNYSTLQGMLTKYKNVTAKFRLTELDVVDFDFTIPIFIDYNDGETSINGYFYVNKIANFKRNTGTTVELIRL